MLGCTQEPLTALLNSSRRMESRGFTQVTYSAVLQHLSLCGVVLSYVYLLFFVPFLLLFFLLTCPFSFFILSIIFTSFYLILHYTPFCISSLLLLPLIHPFNPTSCNCRLHTHLGSICSNNMSAISHL